MGEYMRGTGKEGGLCVPMLSGEFKCACGWAVVVTEVEQSLVIYVMCVRVCGRCVSLYLSPSSGLLLATVEHMHR